MALPRFTTLACSAALLLCGAAQAAGHNSNNDRQSHYQQDRAGCASVPEASRAACIREAGAAVQAARNGQLTSPQNSYESNAMARCQVFKTPADRADCEARMRSNPVSGSVEGGGVLREATTIVPVAR